MDPSHVTCHKILKIASTGMFFSEREDRIHISTSSDGTMGNDARSKQQIHWSSFNRMEPCSNMLRYQFCSFPS
jgi:hypothetical protein